MGLLSYLFGIKIKDETLLQAYAFVKDGFKNAEPKLAPLFKNITAEFQQAQQTINAVESRRANRRINPYSYIMLQRIAYRKVVVVLENVAEQVRKENPTLASSLKNSIKIIELSQRRST